ncbi:MAG: hypothetical protein M1831_002326 [Alyxoria varia]|nr:MAG: hypothetical protein M1831_002326 [Alyxoria varia]
MQSEITIGDEPEEEGENEEEQESEEGDEAEEDDENEDFGYPLDRTSSRADPPPPRSASRARYRSPPPSRSSGLWRDLSPGSQLEEARELMPVLPSLGPPPDPSQTRVTPQEAARRRLPPGPHSLSRQVQRSPEREASEPQESPAVGTQNLTPGTSAAGTENPFPQQSPERTPENAPEGTSQHAPEGTSQQAPEQTSEQEGAGRAGTSSDLSDDIYLITDSAKMTEILKRTERKERNLERRDLENLRKIMVINSVREWAEQNLERGVREEQDPQGQNIAEAESRRQAALEEVRRRFWEIPCVSEGSEQNIFTDDLNSTVDSQDESNDLKQRRPSVGFTHSSFRENFESGMDESGRAKTPIEDLERTVSIMEGTEPASQQQDPQEDSDRLQERRSSVILDRSSIRENVDSEVRESGRTKTPLEDHARTLSIIEGMDPPPQQGCPQQESNSLQRTRPSTGQTRSTSEEFFDNVSGESEGENGTRRGVPRMPSIVEAMNAPPPQENFEESNRSPSRPPGTSRLQPTNKGNPDDEAQESERGHGMVGGSEPRRLENHPMDTPPQQESQETGPRDRLSLTQRLKRFKLWTGKGKDGREENDPPPQSPDDEQAARPEATSEPQALVGKGKGKAKAKPQDSTKGSSFHRAWYGQGIERKNEDAKRLAALFSSAPASFGKGESSQNPGSPDFGSGGRAMGNASAGPVTRLPGNLAPSTTPIQPPTSGADGAVDERRRHFEQRDGGQRGGRQQRSSESERARSHSSGSSGSLERSRD